MKYPIGGVVIVVVIATAKLVEDPAALVATISTSVITREVLDDLLVIVGEDIGLVLTEKVLSLIDDVVRLVVIEEGNVEVNVWVVNSVQVVVVEDEILTGEIWDILSVPVVVIEDNGAEEDIGDID